MKIYHSIQEFSSTAKTIVTLGTFDGVHEGHKSIAEKNRTLSAKALYLSGRNELIEEVIGSLENSGNKEVQPAVKKLKSYLKSDAE